MVRSSRIRSTSESRSSSAVRSSNDPASLIDGRGHDARDRLPQRVAEQRMVIGDDEVGIGSGRHLLLARGCSGPVTGTEACQASFQAIVPCRAAACKRANIARAEAVNPPDCASHNGGGRARGRQVAGIAVVNPRAVFDWRSARQAISP